MSACGWVQSPSPITTVNAEEIPKVPKAAIFERRVHVIKEWLCPRCGAHKETEQSPLVQTVQPTCDACNEPMEWHPRAMSFALKGTGWPGKDGKGR